MKLAVVLVHYHTPQLLRSACEALEADARRAGLELEGVVVDNGSRPEDRELLDSLPFRRLDPGRNLGYAGGANLGLEETEGELALVMNPDVEVLPGCLEALAATLASGAAAAGPRFYWDSGRRFLLPPTEPVSRGWEVLRALAGRGRGWTRLARGRWRRHARRHWRAEEPLASHALSGALLALRRDALGRVGPFDEGYRLYFEETDWLFRLRRAGLEARHVPAAEAVHLYAQSAAREARSEGWFEESARRFRRRAYGPRFTGLLARLSPSGEARPEPEHGDGRGAAWLEAAPSPLGFPAAGRRLAPGAGDARFELPGEIRRRLAAGVYDLRSVAASGRELGLRRLVTDPPAAAESRAPGRR